MRQQVLDDAKSLPSCGRSQSATACDSSYAPNSAQYYSVLQSTTPALLCTTKFYSSTTMYYKVLLQYYCVLQSSTPVLLCAITPVLLCTAPVLLCTTVLLQYYKVLLLCSTKTLLQYYCTTKYHSTTLYYKVLFRTTKSYCVLKSLTWNGTDIARSNKCHPPTSPSTAPATQSASNAWSSSHMVFTVRRATGVTLQPHQKQRLPHKDSHT